MGMAIPKEVRSVLGQLTSDRKIVGECPVCNESNPLSDWNLFYMNNYPSVVKEAIDSVLAQPREARMEYDRLKLKLTKLAAARSVVVNIGKVVEEVAPGLSSFPFRGGDCRSLLDPIDYVVFDGLSEAGKVKQLHFVDVKTGAGRLNDHQKQVKRAVQRHKVEYGVF